MSNERSPYSALKTPARRLDQDRLAALKRSSEILEKERPLREEEGRPLQAVEEKYFNAEGVDKKLVLNCNDTQKAFILSAAIKARNLNAVKDMLQVEVGAKPNSRAGFDKTPQLIEAVCSGSKEIVACLLKAGANPNCLSDGATPL